MTALPPDLQAFAALLDALPGPVQQAFQYCLAMLMVETGKAKLIGTTPGEAGVLCNFETIAGDRLTLLRPTLSEAQEEELKELLRQIVDEEGFQ